MTLARFLTEEHSLTGHATGIQRAIRTEGGDAPANVRTPYVMNVGDTFNGSIGRGGDTDWIRVNLQPGTYTITLDGRGANAVDDPYLAVRNASGGVVAVNDDRSNFELDSTVTLNVTRAGTYYLDAQAYSSGDSGAYSLRVAAPTTTVFTTQQIARQLTDGFWEDFGGSRRAFDVDPGGLLNVDISGLTADGRRLAVAALQAWTDVTGIRFNTNPGAGGVDIYFDDWDTGAYSQSSVFGDTIEYSTVNVGRDWLDAYGTGFASYSFQTYIHEIGHALGLGHAGNYNGSATFGVDNHYRNDSWQASVMSYFDQLTNTHVNASFAYIMSAMSADIMAIRDLYGPATLRGGNTVYGEHSDAGGNYARISNLLAGGARDNIAFTILDDGGVDTLDLRGDTANQRIVMSTGSFSDAYGLVGNISIAQGTWIENLRAGSGNDRVVGNALNNTIWGNNGNDSLNGGAGNDTLLGGAGQDTLIGNVGNDVYHVDSRDTIIDVANGGRDLVHAAFSISLGAHLEDLRLTGSAAVNGTGNIAANVMYGNANANQLRGLGGNDTLNGGAGQDTLIGDVGNDVYHVDSRDRIVEAANGGRDLVHAAFSISLGAHLEDLRLTGSAAVNGTGNIAANAMHGNASANQLRGLGGNDTLAGNGGHDSLWGGAGSDVFLFNSGRDSVWDFQNDVDTIQIDNALWGGTARSVAQLLDAATVVDGDVVFRFGTHSLTVENVANIQSLANDLIIV